MDFDLKKTVRVEDMLSDIFDSSREDARTSSGKNGSRRVLVVDDNADAAEMLGEMLSLAGHVVSVKNDPITALESVQEFQPDVAVLDIGLPGMTGYELAERLRDTVSCQGCRLVALTGYGQEQDRRRSASAGFDHHLVKPVDFERLMNILDQK